MSSTNNYDLLIQKLDGFIRKFYINQLIRGVLYSLGAVLLLFLAVSLAEHYFYFGKGTRKLLWFGFLGASLLGLGVWVLLPLARYFRLGEVISHEKAASIIGNHFGDVQDKLLNVLQLHKQSSSMADASLIEASINQKSAEISPVPFKAAIDLSQNRKYLKYTLPPLLLLLVIILAAPSLISDSTRRLMNNSQDFERPAPFRFVIDEGQKLEVVQFGDYDLQIKVEGDLLPNEAFIEVANYRYRLQKNSPNSFSYKFSNVQDKLPFKLRSGDISSREYELAVLPKPSIAAFEVKLDYPTYLGRKNETLSSIGDLSVPVGTSIEWVFNTQHTDKLEIRFSNDEAAKEMRRFSDDLYTYQKRASSNESYRLYISNQFLPQADSVSYNLAVIPDLYPQISVENFQDSTDASLLFFVGEASDDYGLSKLQFAYQITRAASGEQEAEVIVPIQQPNSKQTRYDYVWDLEEQANLLPGDEVRYYFEVFDNDGVNGAKSARTNMMALRLPTVEELKNQIQDKEEKIKKDLEKAIKDTRELQEDIQKLREKMLQETNMDWKAQKEAEKLLERQEEIQKQIEQVQQAYQENMENQQKTGPQDEKLLEKQEQLQKLFEESLDEKMQQLMEDIQKLMEELNKDELVKKMEDMQVSDEDMEKELDRMLELFKQLELEKEMQETIDKLEELAKEQEKLAEETEKSDKPQEELQEKQEALKEKFEELKEDLEKIQEMNEDLEKPMQLDPQEEMQESIKQDMQDSQEKMEQGEQKESSKSQKSAAQKMKSMAESMANAMMEAEAEQAQEDLDAIRQLLENVVALSFDQEELMNDFNKTTINTPRYVELVQKQFKLNGDFRMVEDSLQALAKRNLNIESYVIEKVQDVKSNLKTSVDELEERQQPKAAVNQQKAMTGLNDLALMLSESMAQAQQQMAGAMPGSQQCENPGQGKGKGKPSSNPGSKNQQSINDAMEAMKKGLEEGKGKGGSSKEFAEMAARQAALRKALQQKQQELRQSGKGTDPKLQELIDEMDKAEEDLVNKRLTNEMIQRQQDILSRMLEHEKAERQQKMDEQRQSETAQQRKKELPPNLQEYIRQREAEIDMFKRVSPELKPYFQGLVNEYFQSLQGE